MNETLKSLGSIFFEVPEGGPSFQADLLGRKLLRVRGVRPFTYDFEGWSCVVRINSIHLLWSAGTPGKWSLDRLNPPVYTVRDADDSKLLPTRAVLKLLYPALASYLERELNALLTGSVRAELQVLAASGYNESRLDLEAAILKRKRRIVALARANQQDEARLKALTEVF